MKKNNKILIIVATSLIVIGLFFSLIGLALGARHSVTITSNGIKVNTGKKITETKDLEAFKEVKIDSNKFQIQLIPSDQYKVEYKYSEYDGKLKINNKDGVLIIEQSNKNNFFNVNFGFLNFEKTENSIKIYYPRNIVLDKIDIDNGMGSIRMNGIVSKDLTINIRMGNVEIQNSRFNNADFDINMGDLEMEHVYFDNVVMNLNMGSIEADELLCNGLKATTNMGDMNLDGTFNGKNILESTMGDIDFDTTLSEDVYRYNISNNLGSTKINDKKVSNNTSKNNGEHEIIATTNMGSINIDFNS